MGFQFLWVLDQPASRVTEDGSVKALKEVVMFSHWNEWKNTFFSLHHDEDHHAMVLLHTFDCSIIATVELAKSFLPLFKLCLNFALIPVTSQTLRTWLQNITLKHLCLSVYFICAPPFPWPLGSSFCACSKDEIIVAQKPAIHHPLERVLTAVECPLAVV